MFLNNNFINSFVNDFLNFKKQISNIPYLHFDGKEFYFSQLLAKKNKLINVYQDVVFYFPIITKNNLEKNLFKIVNLFFDDYNLISKRDNTFAYHFYYIPIYDLLLETQAIIPLL